MVDDFHPYSTAEPYLTGSAPVWLADAQEQLRIRSYMLYEQIYWTAPKALKILSRDTIEPIYVPGGRVIVDTLHRYMGNDMTTIADPAIGSSTEQQAVLTLFEQWTLRERWYSKFNSNRRYGIMRGDWVFMLSGDDTRAEGARVSIDPVDPGSLFPIYEIDEETGVENLDVVVGWHIVEQYMDDDLGEGKAFIKRTTFRKATGTGGPSPILHSVTIFEPDEWGGPGMEEDGKIVAVISPEEQLPDPIDALPVYVIPNFDEPGNIWGSSEMRGLERLLAALSQDVTDEDAALAMDGLGVYATNAGVPIDPVTKQEVGWNIGPGRVVEVPGGKEVFFNRVAGVGSVAASQDHIQYLHGQLDLAAVSPAVAKGMVDVTVAESGVALAIQFGPLVAHALEREVVVTDRVTNLLYGWCRWTTAYESGAFSHPGLLTVSLRPKFGPKLPENKQQTFDNIMAMVTGKVIDLATGWDMLRELGYKLPTNAILLKGLQEEQAALADPALDRINGEIDREIEGDDGGDAG
jgi:hypothetical protein